MNQLLLPPKELAEEQEEFECDGPHDTIECTAIGVLATHECCPCICHKEPFMNVAVVTRHGVLWEMNKRANQIVAILWECGLLVGCFLVILGIAGISPGHNPGAETYGQLMIAAGGILVASMFFLSHLPRFLKIIRRFIESPNRDKASG